MTAREEVLARIRAALSARGPEAVPARDAAGQDAVPRRYRTTSDRGTGELLDLLTERLRDYGCNVRRGRLSEVPAMIGLALAQRGARRVAIPPGLELPGLRAGAPPDLPGLPAGTEIITGEGLAPSALDALDGVITAAALAIAETGTIVLDGSPGQGRRALTLIPDYHLCIVHAGQVVAMVSEAIAMLNPGQPLTWISGPSATSDIELSRVEGVHGPRTLEVILAHDDPAG